MSQFNAEHKAAGPPPQHSRAGFSLLDRLPRDLVVHVLSLLSAPELGIMAQTSRSLCLHAADSYLWRVAYDRFVRRHNIAAGIFDPADAKRQLKHRIAFPQVGDNLEGGWIGKLRTGLASGNCYGGLTWWKIKIVDINSEHEPTKYLLSYIGWRENWQQWVTNKSLRWERKESDLIEQIEQGDSVEYAVVPADTNVCPTGCWLNSVVLEILDEGTRYKLRRTHPRIDVHNGAQFNAAIEEFSLELVVDRHQIRKLKNPFEIK